ncbi:Ig-like domain-containing protein [uncultured Lacinutrix sp.]|uniref:Ig-like domain-containing protein n=1 Tax=uncultured Lacinutrix sp. TaxID=574032 RepID=UPI002622EEC5|nr:Ig-like domain-containing protein [uncultured Lacinutrix sp.]
MKSIKLLFLLFISSIVNNTYAQQSKHFNYQTVVREISGTVIQNEQIGVKISILKQGGIVQYTETFNPTTNNSGIISLAIGNGTPTVSNYHAINWGSGLHFFEISIDRSGGTNYEIYQTELITASPHSKFAITTKGVVPYSELQRDQILAPETGQVIFCSNCGTNGEFQVFNGTSWTNALGAPTTDGPILVNSITVNLDFDDTATDPNNAFSLSTIITPANAANQTVTWTSSDESVITIDASGNITPISNGPVVVTATSTDGGNVTGTLDLNFTTTPGDLEPTSIEIYGLVQVYEDNTIELTATSIPLNIEDENATWVSSDTAIATIDSNGIVTGVSPGEVTITATSSIVNTLTATYQVTVSEVMDVTAPVIDIEGNTGDPILILQRSPTTTIPNATATDDVDGTLPVTVTNTSFNGNVFGDYPASYKATDSSNNETLIELTLRVQDSVAPVITVETYEYGATISAVQGAGLTIPTATAVDDNGDTIPVIVANDGFDPNTIGEYNITYTATDPSNNAETFILTLAILRGDPPTIAIDGGIVNGDTVNTVQFQPFTTPIATATDALGNPVNVIIDDSTIDLNTVGAYTATYTATDSFLEETTNQITVNVTDGEAPIILKENTDLSIVAGILDTPTFIKQVIATDNVGVTNYTITEITEDEIHGGPLLFPDLMYEFLTNNGGTITIDNNGNIQATKPSFEAQFYFKIEAIDAAGNLDTSYISIIHSELILNDVRVSEVYNGDWIQIGYNAGYNYGIEKQPELSVGQELLYLTSAGAGSVNYEGYEINAQPNDGSEDFQIVQDITNPDIYTLKLVNSFNIAIRPNYTLNLNLLGRLDGTTTNIVVQTLTININLKSVTEIDSDFADIITKLNGAPATLRNLFSSCSVGVPTTASNTVFGPIDSVLDEIITAVPIIPEGITEIAAKALIGLSPYVIWVRKDNSILRVFFKFTKANKVVEIEYIDNPTRGCYWAVALKSTLKGSGFAASDISSNLSFLDPGIAAIVTTNTTVTSSDFDCVKIPNNISLLAGTHLVARTKLLGNGVGLNLLLNPEVTISIGVTPTGWADQNLSMNVALNTNFLEAFDEALLDYIVIGTDAAQQGIGQAINGLRAAEDALQQAQWVFDQANNQFVNAQNAIAVFQDRVNYLQGLINNYNTDITNLETNINYLLSQEICTPAGCIPCYYPSFCGYSCGFFTCYFPCIRSCGCAEFPAVCVPDPAALIQVPPLAISLAVLQSARLSTIAALASANATLTAVSVSLSGLQAAVNASQISLDAASLAFDAAEANLNAVQAGFGYIGDVARFILDNTGKLVETSSASFQTTIGSANSGNWSGTLTFGLKFRGGPNNTISTGFSFSDVPGSIGSIGDSLLNP